MGSWIVDVVFFEIEEDHHDGCCVFPFEKVVFYGDRDDECTYIVHGCLGVMSYPVLLGDVLLTLEG